MSGTNDETSTEGHQPSPWLYRRGCRCLGCREAIRQEHAARRARGLADGDPRHGTANGYGNWGCRCENCTEAWRVKHLEYMHADPSRRERHALSQRLFRQARS